MKRFTSYSEIETLCAAMVMDFFRARRYDDVLCVDIEAFVTEYLGLPVVYESFAEPDPGRVGFRSDGKRALWIRKGNGREQKLYPAGTVVIEKMLLDPAESARKRFTIAHEAAHDILARHVPIQSDPAAAFHSEYDPDAEYSGDMLREMLSVNECFANRAAACLLMPDFIMRRVLERYNASRRVVAYGGGVLAQDQKLLIQRMADAAGTSYTAFRVRLTELNLFDRRPLEEYLRSQLRCGGDIRAAG